MDIVQLFYIRILAREWLMASLVDNHVRDSRCEFDLLLSSLRTRYRALSDAAITLEFKAEIARLGAKWVELCALGNMPCHDDRDAALAPILAHWIVGQIGFLEERLNRRPLPFPNRFGAACRRA